MVREHHRLDGYEFEQTPKDGGDRGAWRDAAHAVTELNTTC